jgi:hypothetical protein
MRRTCLCAAVALTMLAGCRDGPTGVIAPEDTAASLERQELASRAAFLAVHEIFDDPFVHELVDDLGVDGRVFHQATRDMTASFVREDLRELSERFHFAAPRSMERDADDEVLRAVLGLIIDDAASVAESHFEDVDSPTGPVGRR